ncbi:MAG: hypothetical protein IPM23_02215 [Candidatus Melainabacteria bacterium]|nr:hypothetical protein [Candidatus Melainabacteria bacterium]
MRPTRVLTVAFAAILLTITAAGSASSQSLIEAAMGASSAASTQKPVDNIDITMDGTVAKNVLLGIPGTTMPASFRIEGKGIVFGLELPSPDMQTRFDSLDGKRVRVSGTLEKVVSTRPDGTQIDWIVLKVQSYMILTN